MTGVYMRERDVEINQLLTEHKAGILTLRDVSKRLGLSYRQTLRKWKAYKKQGIQGLIHKGRGKRSNQAFSGEFETLIISLIEEHYRDFGPTLAAEKLEERHKIKVSHETIRKLMIKNGLWKTKRAGEVKVHQRRPRREHRGELVQIDGSPHRWFEDRGPSCTLLLAVDDATSEILSGHFEPTETTVGYMRMFSKYIGDHGLPEGLYGDRSAIFYTSHGNKRQRTQFARSMKQLGVRIDCAYSPQAKGRVERKNGVLQDRLVKELRLEGISTIEDANKFLSSFLPGFNRKFAKAATNPQDAHKPLKQNLDLEQILATHHTRKITKNLEVHYENRLLQIKEPTRARRLRWQPVIVIEKLDGEILLEYKGELLRYTEFREGEPQPQVLDYKEIGTPPTPTKQPWKPSRYHPWRRDHRTTTKPSRAP